jgi:hypothetical protein
LRSGTRLLPPAPDAGEKPHLLKLDPNAALLLAVQATRGMLAACVHGPEHERESLAQHGSPSSRQLVVAHGSAREPNQQEPAAQLALSSRAACPLWRASAVKRAYLSTLPPPPAAPEKSQPPSHKRWI